MSFISIQQSHALFRTTSTFIILTAMLLIGCGGSLSDEQRKKVREEMKANKITKVTDIEITEAAFAKGRSILKVIENFKGDSIKIDSLLKAEHGSIRWVIPGQSTIHETEQQLINAYLAAASGGAQDNVQKIRNVSGESDSLLYSKPVISQLPNGTDRLDGVWNIWLSKKQLILAMDKKK